MELSLPLRLPRTLSRARRNGVGGLALDVFRARPLVMRLAICAALSLAALGGGWLWLRGSSLVAVEHVHILGVHGPEAIEIRSALAAEARQMTTMRFSDARLRASVASFPIVRAVRARTSFPHGVSISVSERPPVAALVSAGARTAVAADGTVLGPALLSATLPTIKGSVEPPPGALLSERSALGEVAVLGAAPRELVRFVARVYDGPEGLTAAMSNGLLVYFGDASRPHAKWLSLARVLASPSSAGAAYVDVRLPERPAAGFSSATSSAFGASSSSSTGLAEASAPAAMLAERLEKDAGAAAPTGSSTASGESSRGESTSGESAPGESAPGVGTGESESSSGAASTAPPEERSASSSALSGHP